MNSRITIFLLGTVLVLLAGGCGPGRPDGVPNLISTKVTVNNAGKPIAKATVILSVKEGALGSWTVSGITDSSGLAIIKTSQGAWSGIGAPAGDYIVLVSKSGYAPEPTPPGLDAAAEEKFFKEQEAKAASAKSEVPDSLSNPAKTTLKLSVAAGKTAELTVDVSKDK